MSIPMSIPNAAIIQGRWFAFDGNEKDLRFNVGETFGAVWHPFKPNTNKPHILCPYMARIKFVTHLRRPHVPPYRTTVYSQCENFIYPAVGGGAFSTLDEAKMWAEWMIGILEADGRKTANPFISLLASKSVRGIAVANVWHYDRNAAIMALPDLSKTDCVFQYLNGKACVVDYRRGVMSEYEVRTDDPRLKDAISAETWEGPRFWHPFDTLISSTK